jgi:diguanylate cyclase (GGDEF)-like protein
MLQGRLSKTAWTKGGMSAPTHSGGKIPWDASRTVAAAAGVALFLVGVIQGLPPLWLGVIIAGGLTTAASLHGAFTSVLMLLVSALGLWLLPPLFGRDVGLITVVGLTALMLPPITAGHSLFRRVRNAERREAEAARRTRLLTEAAMAMQKVDSIDAMYRTLLRMLADILDFTHAQVFAPRDGIMVLIASHRWEVPAEFGLPLNSVVGEAARTKEPNYVPDVRLHRSYVRGPNAPLTLSELAIPLMMEERVVAVLNIEHVAVDAFGTEERRTLFAFGKMAEEALERASLHTQLVEMLEVIRNLAQSDDPTQLFEETVKSAIRLIPGAEKGSLMLCENGEFSFVAAEGYDRHSLRAISGISHDAQLKWYTGSREDFDRGIPRLLIGDAITQASLAGLETDEQRGIIVGAGRLKELRANICVPIRSGPTVLGMLNIDSFAPSNPFGSHALLLADTFAQQIAVIIRQALYRDALERAVVTDPLTGLGNREGFNRQLNIELARARRYGESFNLVMIDLDGFKSINDRLGHHTGDRVLVEVGEAMERERREGDSVFRWGGDEFALILPRISRQAAWRVAERYAKAITCVTACEKEVSASFGIASYPEDGVDAASLLRKADDLMYRDKSS